MLVLVAALPACAWLSDQEMAQRESLCNCAVDWYPDSDGDGYGVTDYRVHQCEAPEGYVETPGDCDDEDALVYPEAAEYCDGIDNDCDNMEDEVGAVDPTTWYRDYDDDSYGDGDEPFVQCDQPANYVDNDDDCDDQDQAIHPGADEDCDDGRDNDCDEAIDEC